MNPVESQWPIYQVAYDCLEFLEDSAFPFLFEGRLRNFIINSRFPQSWKSVHAFFIISTPARFKHELKFAAVRKQSWCTWLFRDEESLSAGAYTLNESDAGSYLLNKYD